MPTVFGTLALVSRSPTSLPKMRQLTRWIVGPLHPAVLAALRGATMPSGEKEAVGARILAANLLGLLLLECCAVSTPSGVPGHVIAKSRAPGRETRSPSEGA